MNSDSQRVAGRALELDLHLGRVSALHQHLVPAHGQNLADLTQRALGTQVGLQRMHRANPQNLRDAGRALRRRRRRRRTHSPRHIMQRPRPTTPAAAAGCAAAFIRRCHAVKSIRAARLAHGRLGGRRARGTAAVCRWHCRRARRGRRAVCKRNHTIPAHVLQVLAAFLRIDLKHLAQPFQRVRVRVRQRRDVVPPLPRRRRRRTARLLALEELQQLLKRAKRALRDCAGVDFFAVGVSVELRLDRNVRRGRNASSTQRRARNARLLFDVLCEEQIAVLLHVKHALVLRHGLLCARKQRVFRFRVPRGLRLGRFPRSSSLLFRRRDVKSLRNIALERLLLLPLLFIAILILLAAISRLGRRQNFKLFNGRRRLNRRQASFQHAVPIIIHQKPRMALNFGERDAALGVFGEQSLAQIFRAGGELARVLAAFKLDHLVQFACVVVVERQVPGEQRKQDDSARPYVHHYAVVPFLCGRDDFRRAVVWRAALRVKQFFRRVRAASKRRQSEIGDLEVARVLLDEQVLRLEISVAHAARVAVVHAIHHRLEVPASDRFRQLAVVEDLGEQFSAGH
mmetsp:Transcript_17023/g.37002  ORF Transcript_17023/g.37002 Transcript_17023/m.37002 type:complete len:570 (-) Transcript_17023:285-1994(-)